MLLFTCRVLAAFMAFVLFPPSLSLSPSLPFFLSIIVKNKVIQPKYSEYPISSHLVVGPFPSGGPCHH